MYFEYEVQSRHHKQIKHKTIESEAKESRNEIMRRMLLRQKIMKVRQICYVTKKYGRRKHDAIYKC